MKHILHFTHIDSDALGCDVLLKIAYETILKGYKITTYYISNHNVDIFIQDTMSMLTLDIDRSKSVNDIYDIIFITDIGPNKDSIEKIVAYKNKVEATFNKTVTLYGFDHHVTNTLNNDYKWFIVADTLYTLYGYRDDILCDKDTSKFSYYPFKWMHDNINMDYKSYDEAIKDKSLKISATMLVFIHIISLLRSAPCIINSNTNLIIILLNDFVKDISCYDTWEWKNNKYIEYTGMEDKASKLVDMVGIEKATSLILSTIIHTAGTGSIFSTYFPDKYLPIYEFEKYKSFEYVKRSYNNVKLLTGSNIKGLFNILKISDLYNESIPKVYVAISDNTIDIGEQSTFITTNLCKEDCIFLHIFTTSKTLSFRSRAGSNVDVSIIAKGLGGGGHKNASGARVTGDIIGKLIVMYHTNGEDLIDITDGNTITRYVECLSEYMETLPKISTFSYDITDIMKGK